LPALKSFEMMNVKLTKTDKIGELTPIYPKELQSLVVEESDFEVI
jgi:hypothetical protein